MKKVSYNCPRCAAELESPLENAGQRFPCPTCGHELTVPGIEKLNRLRADEAKKSAEMAERAAAKAAEEKRRAEREAIARKEREEKAAVAIREKEERQRLRAELIHRPGAFIAVGGSGVVGLLFVLFYLAVVQPLRTQLRATQSDLHSLTETVNHNAEVANRTSQALDSLRETVNYNARVANANR